ncbi:hypothetical protein JKG68_32070 [Microvirga aerilata]|uniref:Uncharacterized protein n=1 Tax=Microvirga aerilata TaxID=670292 RepID=A0A936ZCT4_9HYPH|nr:hypothetical protein [Microvirga aerilata]MBL0408501.1 hypothetical protein [Microvirga aerilata]
MSILLAFVGVVGGAITLGMLWSYGAVMALSGTPLGASALVLAVSILMALQKSEQPIEPDTI